MRVLFGRCQGGESEVNEPTGVRDELDLLDVDDLIVLLKVTKKWVYAEVQAGRLPAIRLGPKYLRFFREDIREYLKRSRAAADAE